MTAKIQNFINQIVIELMKIFQIKDTILKLVLLNMHLRSDSDELNQCLIKFYLKWIKIIKKE